MFKKTCRQCQSNFTVEDEDLNFYKKISPTFDGRVFDIPQPKLCPDCRLLRRFIWRNERKMYKNSCSLCKEEIISVYAPDKRFKVLCQKCFWSDNWDQLESARVYKEEQSFFDQFNDLVHDTYLLTLFSTNLENCAFCNQEINSQNSYLCTGGNDNRNCFYCTSCIHGNDMSNCWGVGFSEKVHNSVFSVACFNSQYLFNCHMCNACAFCNDCVGCDDCFGCTNLRYKKFHFFNEPLSRDEYKKRIAEYLESYEGINKARKAFNQHKLKYPFKYLMMIASEDGCTGDVILNCKHVRNSYYSFKSENAKHVYIIAHMKDVMDILSTGTGELSYEIASSTKPYSSAFFTSCDLVRNSYYCYNCTNSSDLFGCVSLNKKQYCIFNRQYTKEEYEKEVARIIDDMNKRGEWGEFFPASISPFCYNESSAMDHFPLKTEAEAKRVDAKWQTRDFSMKYNGQYYDPKNISEYNVRQNPDTAEKEIEACLRGIIKCEISGKLFKIDSKELALYIENGVQLPRKHPDIRYKEALNMFNKMTLYRRECMCAEENHSHDGKCRREFETTYAPDRPENIYCEECYQKAVI